jgi:hypothetical protein
MPMLKSCDFPGCDTRTLSRFCLEHEVLNRARAHAERAQAAGASEEPLSAEALEAAASSWR